MMKNLLYVVSVLLIMGLAGLQTSTAQPVVVEYNTPGTQTFTIPAGVTQIAVECWGGGGRGGTRTTDGEGGGGGGGAYAKMVLTVTPGTPYTLVVGAGSSSGTATGGDTWFEDQGSMLVLSKGGASVPNNITTGASGGASAAGIGEFKFSGGNGASATGGATGGGGSSAGTAANGNNATTVSGATAPTGGGAGGNGGAGNNTNGLPGAAPGGGGGGGDRLGTDGTGGNGANGKVIITYASCTPPAFTSCPSNIAQNADAGLCSAVVSYSVTATGAPAFTYLFAGTITGSGNGTGSGASFNTGVTNVTITANNGCAPNATCTFTITVADNQNPVIVCPPGIARLTDPGVCFATVSLGTPITSDNCEVDVVTNNAPATFPIGITIVTWTVADIYGNVATCTQTVTINEEEAPVITCPANITRTTDPGQCSALIASITPPTATDNCYVASIVGTRSDYLSFSDPFPVGIISITWTASDASGNTDVCIQTVTITDSEPPTAICKNISVALNETGIATITAADIDNGSFDNCSIFLRQASKTTFNCANIGTNQVILTVTDIHDNVATCTAVVTVSDPTPATLSINNVTVMENAGNAVFTVTLSRARPCNVSFTAATANNTAIAGLDYSAIFGTYNIPAGFTTSSIVVPIIDDLLSEPDETFYVNLSNPVNAAILNGQGIGTITDNDTPTLAMENITVTEGQNAVFTLTLSGQMQGGFTVDYATTNNTAIAPEDYTPVTGTLAFSGAPGQSLTVTVPTINDPIVEPAEIFFLNLTGISNPLVIFNAQATCTINDNDAATLSINDVSVLESAGNAVFTVTLSQATQNSFTVGYATANNTAIAPGDYTPVSGTLTFGGANPLTQTITVPIINDVLVEPDETYYVNLSNLVPHGQAVTILRPQGLGTIADNDAATLSINNITVNEGAGNAVFTVTLSTAVQNNFSVGYATANNTAIAPGDYATVTGTLTFGGTNPLTQSITVAIADDAVIEPTETFFVNLINLVPNGQDVTISQAQGICTIIDNDEANVSIGNVTVSEAAGTAVFTVTLNDAALNVFTVDFATANNTAIAPGDYTPVTGTLTFGAANPLVRTVAVTIINDALVEPTETFFVNLSNLVPNGQTIVISNAQGVGTITDNDAATLSINDVSVLESAGNAVFTVTLSQATQNNFTVGYATANNTAIAPGDYTPVSGTLSFGGANPLTRTITVPIINDALVELTETYYVNLSNLVPNGQALTIIRPQGLGTITDDDVASLSIGNVTVNEGAGNAVFSVTLSTAVPNNFTVSYATANNTAIAPADYTTVTGTLTFGGANPLVRSITVPIIDDALAEPTETFYVNLSNLVTNGQNIIISNPQGIGTILDNDTPLIRGDANCDGFVNVLDVVSIINYILGSPPALFCLANADSNNDGMVDVLDVIATINIILGGGKKAEVISAPASIWLAPGTISFSSDGTLAGLQFELQGPNINNIDLQLLASHYQLSYFVAGNKLTGMIHHPANVPLPAGKLDLLRIRGAKNLSWGQVHAANTGAKRVAVNKYTLSDEYALGVYPNPAREFFDIRVVLPGEAHVSLRLFDLAGRQVASLANALYGEGEHLLSTGTGHGLAPGIYLLQMKATPVEEAGHSFTREMKVVIM